MYKKLKKIFTGKNKNWYLNFLVINMFGHNINFFLFKHIIVNFKFGDKRKNNIFVHIILNNLLFVKHSAISKNFFLKVKISFNWVYNKFYQVLCKNFFFSFLLNSSKNNILFSLKNFYLNNKINIQFLLHKSNKNFFNLTYNYSNQAKLLLNIKKLIISFSTSNSILNNINLLSSAGSFFLLFKIFFFLPLARLNTTNSLYIYSTKLLNINYRKINIFKNNYFYIFKYLNILNFKDLDIKLSRIKKITMLKLRKKSSILRKLFSNILIRFATNIFGLAPCFIFDFNPYKNLSNYEWSMLEIFMRRLAKDRRSYWKLNTRYIQNENLLQKKFLRRGDVIYWKELITCCFLFFKLRDSTFLMNYLIKKSSRMYLKKHRFFFSRIFNTIKTMFFDLGPIYNVIGIKIQVTGKISVTGNSRTRTMIFKQGKTNYSNASCKCDYSFNIVKTNTGCLGLNLYMFYK